MISVILPTVRPHLISDALRFLHIAAHGTDYEIVVVADFKCPWEYTQNMKWIESERKGVIDANIKGYQASSGDYVMTTSDEARLYPLSLRALQNFCEVRGNKVLTSPTHIPFFNFKYYGKWFAPFPFAHRSLIEECGGLFLPEYKSFYADPDLSLRAYEKGFEVKECGGAIIHHPNNMRCPIHMQNVADYTESDREVFKKKWAHLGEFKDP